MTKRTLGFSGECSNKECDFLHVKTPSEAQACPSYDQGFCKDGEAPTEGAKGTWGPGGRSPGWEVACWGEAHPWVGIPADVPSAVLSSLPGEPVTR